MVQPYILEIIREFKEAKIIKSQYDLSEWMGKKRSYISSFKARSLDIPDQSLNILFCRIRSFYYILRKDYDGNPDAPEVMKNAIIVLHKWIYDKRVRDALLSMI